MTMTATTDVTYLGQPLTRDALRLFLGDDATVLPLPTDEAGAEFLRGENLILVPLSDRDRTIRSTAALIRAAGITCSISPVSAEWFAAVMPEPAVLRSLLAGEKRKTSTEVPRLLPEQTSVRWLADFKRVEFPMILENLLPAGIVGGINAEGGVGKTYLLISMFAAIATGLEFGPFRPTRPHRVLLLLAEDPLDVVRNRIHDICRELIPPSHHELLALNFHCASVRGISGPLMALKDGNAVATEWMDWLDATLEAHPGTEVLGLDPLRKFLGLDENKNEFAHAFVGLLEAATLRHSLTALYAHHIAKAIRGAAVHEITGRGAGGLSDNCRWMAAMRVVDPNTFANLELEGSPHEYVEFAVTKSNYAALLPAPVYFRRGEHGVLSPMPAQRNRLDTQAEYLTEMIANQEYSRRDVEKSIVGKPVRDAMKERFSGWTRKDFNIVIQHAINTGMLVERETEHGPRNVVKVVLERGERVPF